MNDTTTSVGGNNSNSTNTDTELSYESSLVIAACICVILILIVVLVWLISKAFRSKRSVIFDMCSVKDAAYFYSFKVKLGKLPVELLTGPTSLRIDLIDSTGKFATRLEIPIVREMKDQVEPRKKTTSITFKVGRASLLPAIGAFRIDHNVFGRNVYVDFIVMQDLNRKNPRGRNNVKANISSEVPSLIPNQNIVRYTTEQIFPVTERDGKVGVSQKPTVE